MKQPTICIAPLDWGLGHATRCIPLVEALQKLGYLIYIASEGQHEAILREALPEARFLHLRGYHIHYSKRRSFFVIAMALQIPSILYSMWSENRWLRKTNRLYQFDLIISDNRLGFYSKDVPSVFITHQLNLQTEFKWSTWLMQVIQYTWFRHFNALWIPDREAPNNIAGILSNPKKMPKQSVWYMGCLARLHQQAQKEELAKNLFLGIVSGPEPQRSILQEILWREGNTLTGSFEIIAGTPLDASNAAVSKNGRLHPHLGGAALASAIQNAEYIVFRGGYTSLMELIPFHKKLIIVPTPGQTEQEYLAQLWEEKGWAIAFPQSRFKLADAIKKASSFHFKQPPFATLTIEGLKAALKQVNL